MMDGTWRGRGRVVIVPGRFNHPDPPMTFQLDQVVPWGRSFDEYAAMFALDEGDLAKRILGCGDGPASFNAGLTARGGRAVSVDPIYRFSREDLAARIEATYPVVLEQTRRNAAEFVWSGIPSVEELGRVRRAAMEAFLADYPAGSEAGRYVVGALPGLPFTDRSFDLALCSHFLFLYSAHFDEDFHVRALLELLRVAQEVRVFPLLELGAVRSRHLDGALARLAGAGCRAEVAAVPYEFQRGGNEMLVLSTA